MRVLIRALAPAALPLLAACSTVSGHDRTAAVGETLTLRPGESAAVADAGMLRYERLVNDSRCRPDVQCIWAGDAEVAFTWTPSHGAPEQFSLPTKPDAGTHPLGSGHTLRLLTLERGEAPAATLQVDPTR